MKKFLFFSLILLSTVSFACNKKKKKKDAVQNTTSTTVSKLNTNEVWMQYDETKCQNPWQLSWFQKPTEEQLRGAVKSQLIGQEIAILEIQSTNETDFIACEACTCPNGRHYYVRVPKSEIEKLIALNFYEVKESPQILINNKNK